MMEASMEMTYKPFNAFNIDKNNEIVITIIGCKNCGYCNRSYMVCEDRGVEVSLYKTCNTPKPKNPPQV